MPSLKSRYRKLFNKSEPESFDDKVIAALNRNRFYKDLNSGNLGISFLNFLLYSLLSGIGLSLLFVRSFSHPFVLFGIFLNGLVIPYVLIKQQYIKNKMVEAMRFKEFLETLISEFMVGSSTTQALANILKMKRLLPDIRESFERMIHEIQLGQGVVTVLRNENQREELSKDLRIVLSVLIINHESGSSDTIRGLQSVGLQLKDRTENLVDLKKAMAGIVGQRYVFFILVIALPILLGVQRDGYFTYSLNHVVGIIGIGMAYYISFFGQIIMDSVISRTANKF